MRRLLTIALFCLVPPSGLSAQQLVVITADGREFEASLESVSDRELRVRIDDQPRTLPVNEVFGIRRRTARIEPADDTLEIGLVDGSRMIAGRLAADPRQIEVTLTSGQTVSLSREQVHYVRLVRYDHPSLEDRWQEIVMAARAEGGDLLVFRRADQLDYLEGLVSGIDETGVAFQRDGQINRAPRNRVDALVYFQPVHREFARPVARLQTVAGDEIQVRALTVGGHHWTVTTPGGAELPLAPSDLVTMEFGNRQSVHLSSLTPVSVRWEPLVPNPEILEFQRQLNQPQFDRGFDGRTLRIRFPAARVTQAGPRIVEYTRGIAIKGGTRIAWSLDGQYARLVGVAAIPPEMPATARAELVIAGDGQELVREVLQPGGGPPLEIDLPATDVQRLTIQVNYLDGQIVGNIVNLCDVRLVR